MTTPWHRLSSRKSRQALNLQVRQMALDLVIRKLGVLPTAQDVRRALGLRAKSSICEACWRSLIEEERRKGRIALPRGREVGSRQRGGGDSAMAKLDLAEASIRKHIRTDLETWKKNHHTKAHFEIIFHGDGETSTEESEGVETWCIPIVQMLTVVLETAREPKTCSGRNFGLHMSSILMNMRRK